LGRQRLNKWVVSNDQIKDFSKREQKRDQRE
jgi:hypothetical protein